MVNMQAFGVHTSKRTLQLPLKGETQLKGPGLGCHQLDAASERTMPHRDGLGKARKKACAEFSVTCSGIIAK